MPPIKALMTPFPYSVGVGASLDEAETLMREHRFRHLPVMDGGHLVGVLSDRDLKRAAQPAPGETAPRVGDVARLEAYVVPLTEPADRVLAHMAEHHLDAALVVKEGRLAGIFTATDACRGFADFLRRFFPSGGGEAA